jgi:ribosomal protein S18 acetylase RimI-like enzyme
MESQGELAFVVRPYRACDRQACRKLFYEGLVGGRIADGDTGADIDCIETHYLAVDGNHFWVAEVSTGNGSSPVVGMIGVQAKGDGTAEIRRLRVDERYRRRGIGKALMEEAVKFCKDQNYIRIILDTFMERDPAIQLFQKLQFRHGRTRKTDAKDLLYFYLDLYGKPNEGE